MRVTGATPPQQQQPEAALELELALELGSNEGRKQVSVYLQGQR